MNNSQALSGSSGSSGSEKPFIDSHAPLATEQPELGLKHLSLSDPDNKPAPQSLADFTITKAEQPATAQDDLATRFQLLCTNDDGTTLASILSGMSEEEVRTWLNTDLPYSERHDTPMMYVARRNCASMASVLMSHKADPVAINPHSETASHPLYIAAQENNVEVLRVMSTADTFAPDTPRSDGSTALSVAVKNHSLEVTRLLLECKADPNYKSQCIVVDGELRLIECCTEDEAARGIKFWNTLMNVAAAQEQTQDSVKIFELLLSKGGKVENIDPDNPFQPSPLASAILGAVPTGRSCEKFVDLLLSHGADMYEPFPLAAEDIVSPAQISQSAPPRALESMVRPSICEYVCLMSTNPIVLPVGQIIHKHYLLQEGSEKMPWKEFVGVNGQEGFLRAAAVYGFPEEIMPILDHVLPHQPNSTRTVESDREKLLAKLLALDALGITVPESVMIGRRV